MRITVITVCKDAGSTLERSIQSIVRQDWRDLEYIVVDGASTDNSLEIIGRYRQHISSLTSEPDSGVSEAFNKGLARAHGELVIFINADDQLVPDALAQIAADWERLGGPDVLCGATRYLDPESGSTFKEVPCLDHMHKYMSVYHPSMCATRSAYERVGRYREDFELAMDCEWIHRAMRMGLDIKTSQSVYSVMSLQGVSDRRYREALKEFRRSTIENGLYRPSTDVFYCQQLVFKSMMRLGWFKRLKYRLDSMRQRKEWDVM